EDMGKAPAGVPAALLSDSRSIEHAGAGRRLQAGVNYVELNAEAGRGRSLDAVMGEGSEIGRVVGALPRSVVLGFIERGQSQETLRSAAIGRTRPVMPYEKVAGTYGARPEMNRSEALRLDVLSTVTFAPEMGGEAGAAKLRAIPGVTEVEAEPFGDSVGAR